MLWVIFNNKCQNLIKLDFFFIKKWIATLKITKRLLIKIIYYMKGILVTIIDNNNLNQLNKIWKLLLKIKKWFKRQI